MDSIGNYAASNFSVVAVGNVFTELFPNNDRGIHMQTQAAR
jgi:hypothetical protein